MSRTAQGPDDDRQQAIATLPAVIRRASRIAAVLTVLLLAGTACSGGDRPSMGDEVQDDDQGLTVRHLDPELTYVARADHAVDVFETPGDDDPQDSLRPPAADQPTNGLAIDGWVVQAPYETEPGFHEVALADGSTGWVDADDVRVQQVNIVAVANGTEVDTSGGGGGTVAVFAQPDAPQPLAEIENPKSAEGLSVGPVVFLANGPVDPSADWLNVLLPIRPNGTDGWVRRSDVTLTANQFRIEVHLGAHEINVFDANQEVLSAPIGVGTGETPTPGGAFYIRSLIASTDPVYGTYAFGLSGFSEVHESFNGGPGDIGIHGTNNPDAVGTDVSNGCIRLTNDQVEALAGLLPEASGPQSDAPAVTTGLGVPVRVLA
jgi:lipoprotein-anchoring transpeptidase ErfK/SrfK